MMRSLVLTANKIALGDISERKRALWTAWNHEGRELQKAFRGMITSLRTTETKVSESVALLENTARKIRLGAEQSARVSEQVAVSTSAIAEDTQVQLNHMAFSQEKISQIVEEMIQAARQAEQVSLLSKRSADLSQAGSESLGNVVRKMEEIEAQVHNLSQVIEAVDVQSQRIAETVEIIKIFLYIKTGISKGLFEHLELHVG